jgi:hypothetical protein
MAGYTPLYDTLLSGTLYGRWPHTGIWACLLSRASREGLIDEVPASLAAAIGVDVATLEQCIADFMEPDSGSRTQECDGRRLELIDPARPWGWRIINHGKYREKARKKNYDDERTESGIDAERKRAERASRDVPRSPALSPAVPLSSPSPSPSPEEEKIAPAGAVPPPKAKGPKAKPRTQIGERTLTEGNRAYALAKVPDLDADATYAQFRDHHLKLATVFADWDAAWRTWIGNITTKDFAYVRAARTEANRAPAERLTREQWKARKTAASGL